MSVRFGKLSHNKGCPECGSLQCIGLPYSVGNCCEQCGTLFQAHVGALDLNRSFTIEPWPKINNVVLVESARRKYMDQKTVDRMIELERALHDVKKQIWLLAELLHVKFEGSDSSLGVKMLPICEKCGK